MMYRKQVLVSTLLLFAGVTAACTPSAPISDPGSSETAAPTTQLLPSESTEPPSTDSPVPAATATASAAASTATSGAGSIEPQLMGLPQVELAKADLAGRLGVAPVDIMVATVRAVTWPNGGLGCPQPGMVYAEVLVEGLFIQLTYSEQVYNYHSGGMEPPFLCEQAQGGAKTTPAIPELGLTPPAPDN